MRQMEDIVDFKSKQSKAINPTFGSKPSQLNFTRTRTTVLLNDAFFWAQLANGLAYKGFL